MNLIKMNEMKKLIIHRNEYEIESESITGIDIYNSKANKFITYHNLEVLNIQKLFEFNSFKLDEKSFFKIIEDCFNKNMFMTISRIIFISNEMECDNLIDEFPEQYINMKEAVGIHFHEEDVIVINLQLIKELSISESNEFISKEELFSKGVWETLIHELRHSLTENKIIPESILSKEEQEEDKVEEYCLMIFNDYIKNHENANCFYMNF